LFTQVFNAARIDASSFVVFVDQRFEVAHGSVAFGASQWGSEVVDDHRTCTAFGLGAFAGIIDDEGIDVGCGAKDRFGPAILAKGHGFAGQPFEVSMFAHVHDCVRAPVVPQRCLVAIVAQKVQRVDCGCGRVEADAVGEAAVLVGVVGEDEGDLFVFWGRVAQVGPVFGQLCDVVDAVADALVGRDGAFGGLIKEGFAFEADGAGQDAAVDLWQGHVHGDVARRGRRQHEVSRLRRLCS